MKLTDDYTQRLETPSDMQGHLPYLCHVAAKYEWIVELGVRSGNSTCAFLHGIYSVRRGHLWSIDINPPDVPEQWHRMPRWSFLQADDMSPEAQAWVPRWFDVLFIDTDPHSYDGCLAELHAYGPRVKPGGLILVHDTHPSAAAEPARALSEYTRLRGLEDNLSFIEDSHGLGVLRIGLSGAIVPRETSWEAAPLGGLRGSPGGSLSSGGSQMLDLQVALHVFLSVLILGTLWHVAQYHLMASSNPGIQHVGKAMSTQY